jgi:hypothetical protein
MRLFIARALVFIMASLTVLAAPERQIFLVTTAGTDDGILGIWQNDEHALAALRRHCAAHGKLWLLAVPGSFTCTRYDSPDKGSIPEIATRPIAPQNSGEPMLMSLSPFPKQDWTMRPVTSREFAKYSGLSRLKGVAKRQMLVPENMSIIQMPRRPFKFVILPYSLRHNDCGVDDECFEETVTNAVFVDEGHKPRKLYTAESDIKPLGDLDGDGIPELLISPYCDGDCYDVVQFYPSVTTLLSREP